MSVVIETTLGDITVDLFLEERPRACLNFLKLCKLKYYNYNLFHNIERNFIAQTGDPTGVGDGGQSIWGIVEGSHKRFFEAENIPKIRHEIPGLLSLVSIGKNMVSSQFFFTLGQDLISLDNIHCVIGEVTEGHDILRKLNEAIVDEKFRPYQDIRITHTVILEDPFDDPRGFRMPSRSPSPTAERLKNGRIAADENIDDTDGKTTQEIQEMLAEKEAKARATILEIIGDLPDAEIAPPENVLFVCKLNPVTTEDDLEIIFSRFGKVVGCEVITDKISGDSLQYAFVEFKDKKSCEAAYFKMDNVLIDDRRIHVDFSQSVAKVQWRGKGRGLIYKDGKEDQKLDFNNYRERKKLDKKGTKENRNERSLSSEKSSEESAYRNKYRTRRSRSRSSEKNSRNRDNHKRFYDNRSDNFRSDRRNFRSRSRSRNRQSSFSRYQRSYQPAYDNRLSRDRKYEKREYIKNRSKSRSSHKTYSSSKKDSSNAPEKRYQNRNEKQSENFKGERSCEQMKHENFEQKHKAKDSYNKEHDNRVSNKKKAKKNKRNKTKKDKASKTSKKKRQYSESESTDSSSSSTTSTDSESTKRKRSRRKKKKRYSSTSESSNN